MERIWITGSPGSGKTTLANMFGAKLDILVYHNDRIFWRENWQQRDGNEQIEITRTVTENEKWIYEGNRFNHCKEDGRFDKCDTIIYIDINRLKCLYRAIKRYFKHKGTVRPDISEGCVEMIDMEFIKYILIGYPKKKSERQKLFYEAERLGKKVIIIKRIKKIYDLI